MPFTFSHPAIILPFMRTRSAAISMSALVVGSMIPDFQYFFSMKLNGRFSHTFSGILLFDLPVGLLIWLAFHAIVRKPLIENLPQAISGRLQPLYKFDFKHYASRHPVGLITCILSGTASHILWDGLTHHDGVFVPFIPMLDAIIRVDGLPELPLFRYLQHISTVVGAAIVIYVFFKMPVHKTTAGPEVKFWLILFAFAIPAFLIRACFGIEYYGDLAVIIISSLLLGLISSSALTLLKSKRK